MISFLRPIRWFDTLKGQITLILVIGMFFSAIVALLMTEIARQADLEHVKQERVIASAVDIISRLQSDNARTIRSLENDSLLGTRLWKPSTENLPHTTDYTRQLRERLGSSGVQSLVQVPYTYCVKNDVFWGRPRTAGMRDLHEPDCWLLTLSTEKGTLRVNLFLPYIPMIPSSITSPFFLSVIGIGSLTLALVIANLASKPLARLTHAANAFAHSIDAPPVAETGPADVRTALTTFNLMQERVREGVKERTRILAAISHDLQTPLTRLRLRLEQVPDETLRDRLIRDLSGTMAMIKRGLELARSSESMDDWVVVNLHSLLSSLADDAIEAGQSVTLLENPPIQVRVRLDALKRCLMNLLDNALKYGGSAEIYTASADHFVSIHIRDHGPGVPAELLSLIFEPFVRSTSGKASGDGTGIGLTIAKAQGAAIGGTVALSNHPEGGALASLTLPVYDKRAYSLK